MSKSKNNFYSNDDREKYSSILGAICFLLSFVILIWALGIIATFLISIGCAVFGYYWAYWWIGFANKVIKKSEVKTK